MAKFWPQEGNFTRIWSFWACLINNLQIKPDSVCQSEEKFGGTLNTNIDSGSQSLVPGPAACTSSENL